MSKVDFAFIGGRGMFSSYGGVENATREITLELAKSDINLLVYGVEAVKNNELPLNLAVESCPAWLYKKLGQYGFIFYCVLHALFVARPKVVYLFASGPCVFTLVLRLGGLKVVTSLRAIDSARDKWGVLNRNILRFGEYCAWRFSNSFTVNSKEMLAHYSSNREDAVFIPNGSTVRTEKIELPALIKGKKYFLFAARLDPVKRLHLLLDAYTQLEISDRPILVIAGGNAKNKAYEAELKSYESDSVVFLGHLSESELVPVMNNCRAFILPSILEGMSNSLLSAMAAGKPVLAADIPANSDVLENKAAMYAADSMTGLVNGLTLLAEDDDFCLNLGNALQKRAKDDFSWAVTAKQFYMEGKDYL